MTTGTGGGDRESRMNRKNDIRCAKTVDDIIKDLCDRSGLQNEWEGIDEEVRGEIRQAWLCIIREHWTPKPQPQVAPAYKGECAVCENRPRHRARYLRSAKSPGLRRERDAILAVLEDDGLAEMIAISPNGKLATQVRLDTINAYRAAVRERLK